MKIPGFTAEESLYKTGGHYRNGRPAFTSLMQPIRAFQPAAEVIEVHGCPPGWTDIGGTCWPDPLTESSSGDGGQSPGGDGGFGEGETYGGGGGPRPKRPKRPPKEDQDRPANPRDRSTGPHNPLDNCTVRQVTSDAAQPCHYKMGADLMNGVPLKDKHYLRCTGSQMECCKDFAPGENICDEL